VADLQVDRGPAGLEGPGRVAIGDLAALQERGCLTGKAGDRPICVFWSDGEAFAIDDRCPHMGFPLHRGTVESGLVTCHWHNARFDLTSGGTLDPWADDVSAYPVEINGSEVVVVIDAPADPVEHLRTRLQEGLEQGITLVIAKAVLGLLAAGVDAAEIVAIGTRFGVANRDRGWGAGLTVLTAMANVLDDLDSDDRGLALVHGLAFVARDTRGHPPRFELAPLGRALPASRLSAWYRRFVETRSADAAERTLASAIAGHDAATVADLMFAAVTDHVFIDGGHTIDFTNKAFEAVARVGRGEAGPILGSLVAQTAAASRSEERGAWRYPHDLAEMIRAAEEVLPDRLARARRDAPVDVSALAWALLADEPEPVVTALDAAIDAGATPEELARALTYAAALRLARFHTQNDHADWDEVHHAFTAANALHQAIVRSPSPELLRGVYHGAMRVYLDRFLNIPPARLPSPDGAGSTPTLAGLDACWEREGMVDEAGAIVHRYLQAGGDPGAVTAALGRALLAEDAEFHWYQTVEAAFRQFHAWPAGSEEAALVVTGTARFLAAHTPTRRELAQVVRIASRLRRGESLYRES
jgi:nitrite reductase/ring-hydroxylating ferredoxin subunit